MGSSTNFVSNNKACKIFNVSETTVCQYLLQGEACNGYTITLK